MCQEELLSFKVLSCCITYKASLDERRNFPFLFLCGTFLLYEWLLYIVLLRFYLFLDKSFKLNLFQRRRFLNLLGWDKTTIKSIRTWFLDSSFLAQQHKEIFWRRCDFFKSLNSQIAVCDVILLRLRLLRTTLKSVGSVGLLYDLNIPPCLHSKTVFLHLFIPQCVASAWLCQLA